jgi:hypothetical protein
MIKNWIIMTVMKKNEITPHRLTMGCSMCWWGYTGGAGGATLHQIDKLGALIIPMHGK